MNRCEGASSTRSNSRLAHSQDAFDTVLVAIGRDADLSSLNLPAISLSANPKSGKVIVDALELTQAPSKNIHALGDILEGKPELTPLAIQTGRLLARRLFTNSTEATDYDMIPTTVFTPLEYGAIGLSEEEAIERFGADNVEVYHGMFKPLEWTVSHREDNACYSKLVCVLSENERVVGFHYGGLASEASKRNVGLILSFFDTVGPNAGEVTQGYAVAMRMGATRAHFASTIGIHPTTSVGLL